MLRGKKSASGKYPPPGLGFTTPTARYLKGFSLVPGGGVVVQSMVRECTVP